MAKRQRPKRKQRERDRATRATLDTIATLIINLSANAGGITHGKLQLILFYAQAVSLAQQDGPLWDEDFVAEAQGPMLPSVRARFAHYGNGPIANLDAPDAVPNHTYKAIGPILGSFGIQTEATLREMACAEPPWLDAHTRATPDGQKATIHKRTMSAFYRQRDAAAAAAPPAYDYS